MFRKFLPVAFAAVLVMAACSADSSGDTSPPSTLTTTSSMASTTTEQPTTTTEPVSTTTTEIGAGGFPVTIDAANGPVTIESMPERIVSISPTSTEVLFAIGAGAEVVAVDDQSSYPPEAPLTDLSGFTPNVEAIAAFEPDVVFLSYDPTGDTIPSLEAIGIPVILHPTALTIEDAYSQWEQTGAATGHIAEAVTVVDDTTKSLKASVDSLPDEATSLSFYFELDPTYYSVTSSTFVGGLVSLTGMTNIADEADPDGYGYPQLTSEYIVDSDPALIYLADTKCCGQSLDKVADRPGWGSMSAVANGSVVELDDDIASRWGPRITVLMDDVVQAVLQLESADA